MLAVALFATMPWIAGRRELAGTVLVHLLVVTLLASWTFDTARLGLSLDGEVAYPVIVLGCVIAFVAAVSASVRRIVAGRAFAPDVLFPHVLLYALAVITAVMPYAAFLIG